MEKVLFKYTLKNNNDLIDYEGIGKYKDKVLTFWDNDGTKVMLDFISNKIVRDNKEIDIEIDFLNNNGTINIKELNQSMDLDIKIGNVIIEESMFKIEYKIEDNLFVFDISWEELGD